MKVSKTQPPPIEKFPSFVFSFERGLDPWHADAFPDEFKHVGTTGKRQSGWLPLDFAGNAVGFIPDGTEYEDVKE